MNFLFTTNKAVFKNQKGFTLMEILAVLLIIAVVLSFAVPAYRSMRYEHYNGLAKAGVKKISEAMRSFYQNTKGYRITGSFSGTSMPATTKCNDVAASGIPSSAGGDQLIDQLFACGYLNYNDFVGLPYKFTACPSSACNGRPFAVAQGETGAGTKYAYSAGYLIFLDDHLRVTDTLDD